MTGTLALRGDELSGEIDAASPRLAITGTGRIALTPQADCRADVPLPRHLARSLRPAVRAAAVAVHDRGRERIDPRRRRAGRRRSPAGRRRRSTAVELRLFDYAMQNAAPIRLVARSARRPRRAISSSSATTPSSRVGGHDRPARRADCAAGGRRREPRHPAGLLPRRARLGPRRADRGRRRPAARAGVLRQRHDHRRPRPPFLAAELARCDQRRDARSTRAASGSTS